MTPEEYFRQYAPQLLAKTQYMNPDAGGNFDTTGGYTKAGMDLLYRDNAGIKPSAAANWNDRTGYTTPQGESAWDYSQPGIEDKIVELVRQQWKAHKSQKGATLNNFPLWQVLANAPQGPLKQSFEQFVTSIPTGEPYRQTGL